MMFVLALALCVAAVPAKTSLEPEHTIAVKANGDARVRSVVKEGSKPAKSSIIVRSGKDMRQRKCFPMPPAQYMLEHSSYLPAWDSLILPPTPNISDSLELRKLWSEQAKLCAEGPEEAMQMRPHGFGGSLSSMLKVFTRTFEEKEPFLTPTDHLGRPITHYGMMPTSDCPTQGFRDYYPDWIIPKEMSALGRFKEKDLFWWTAQQWAWLLRPNATLQHNMDTLKSRLDWETKRPILGLHVRHGDACAAAAGIKGNTRKCDGLATYMKHVAVLAKKYGYKSIFLATDSAEVAVETAKYTDFTWIQSPTRSAQVFKHALDPNIYFDNLWTLEAVPRSFDDVWRPLLEERFAASSLLQQNSAHEWKKQNTDPIEALGGKFDFDVEFRDFIVDILLLADTDGFVGKFTSYVDRIAYALGAGQTGCATPFVSLDSIWCNDFGQQTGKSTISETPFWC